MPVVQGSRPTVPNGPPLYAWLYDVLLNGTCHPTWGEKLSQGPKIVPSTATLRVSTEVGADSSQEKYLRVPTAVGMAIEPVAVSPDPDTGHWKIRNRGMTNNLRIQPYGLRAIPLRAAASMAMPGADVAVWIPVVRHDASPADRREAFRLLILHAPEPVRTRGVTLDVTSTRVRALTTAMQEAIIVFFGEFLSWPPLPTPHVRQESEIKRIAQAHGLLADKGEHWARNRNEVLSGADGLFTAEAGRWYPPLGGAVRSAGNYLPAFQRLIELGAVNSSMVRRWVEELRLESYLTIDGNLML